MSFLTYFGLRCLVAMLWETTALKLTLYSWWSFAYSFYYCFFYYFNRPLLISLPSFPSVLLDDPLRFEEEPSSIDLLSYLVLVLFLMILFCLILLGSPSWRLDSSINCALFFLKLFFIILSYSCSSIFFYFFSKSTKNYLAFLFCESETLKMNLYRLSYKPFTCQALVCWLLKYFGTALYCVKEREFLEIVG